jgi:hypothetical protein
LSGLLTLTNIRAVKATARKVPHRADTNAGEPERPKVGSARIVKYCEMRRYR